MSSKKYIPTVHPLFAVILQAYKKVKVGKPGGIQPGGIGRKLSPVLKKPIYNCHEI